MKVLVTGATGFIGRYCVRQLLARGDAEVIAVGRTAEALAECPDAHRVTADILDIEAMRTVLRRERPSHLLHLAWDVTPGAFWATPANLDWVAASLLLQRTFVESGGRRAVIAGTAAEYDWQAGGVLDEQSTPLSPGTLYGVAKDALRRVSLAAAAEHGYSVAWGRIFWLYGPGEKPGRLVSDVARALAEGRPVKCSAGLQRRDFLHVSDVAAAFVGALGSDWAGAFNIGSGESVAIRDIVRLLADDAGRPELVELGALPSNASEPALVAARIDILRNAIGVGPFIPLERGLADTMRWWREACSRSDHADLVQLQ